MFCLLLFTLLFAEEIPSIYVTEPIDLFSQENYSVIPNEKVKTSLFMNDLLKGTPSVQIIQNGGPGGRSSFFIRGTESRHTLVLWGGVRLNDPTNTDRQFDSAFLRPHLLEKVIIKKSPEPVMYGGDALGGVIELIPKFQNDFSNLSLGYGSFNTKTFSVTQNFKSNKNKGLLLGSWFKTDGISRLNKKRFKAKEKDGSEIVQFQTQSQHDFSDVTYAQVLLQGNKGWSEQDGMNQDNNKDLSISKQFLFSPSIIHQVSSNNFVQVKTALNHNEREIKSMPDPELHLRGDLQQVEFESTWDLKETKYFLSTGHWKESYNDADVGKSINTSFVSSIVELKYKEITFIPGIRAEENQRFGQWFSKQMTMSYGIFFVKWAQGYKPPSLYQLYAPDLFGFVVGNENLKPEKNDSREFGIKYKALSLTLFENKLSNLIQYNMTNGYQNQGSLSIQGVETALKFPIENFEVNIASTYQEFKHESTRILRRPNLQHYLSISKEIKDKWNGSIDFNWLGSRYDINENSTYTKLNAYEVVHIKLQKRFKNQDYLVRINNLFNRNYEEVYGYSVMPLSLDVQWNFHY